MIFVKSLPPKALFRCHFLHVASAPAPAKARQLVLRSACSPLVPVSLWHCHYSTNDHPTKIVEYVGSCVVYHTARF